MFTDALRTEEEERKLIKVSKKVKFNGMDLFIVIVAVVIVAAGAYLLFGADGGSSGVPTSRNVDVSAVVELTAKDAEFAEIIKNGDAVLVGEKTRMATTVSGVEVVPAMDTGYDAINGRVLRSEIPEKVDIRVTLSALGAETDRAIEIDGTAIKVGQKVVISSKNWAGEGYVTGLEIAEPQ